MWRAGLVLLILGSLALFGIGVALAADTQPVDLSSIWKGEWAYFESPGDQDPPQSNPDFLYQGKLSIYDCKDSSCSLSLDYGNQSSLCELTGQVQLKSETLATYDDKGNADQQACHVDLIFKNGKIDVAGQSDGCSDYCGHAGGNFGADYKRYTDKHYYGASYNCLKAKTNIEISICTDKTLASLDTKLSSTIDQKKDYSLTPRNDADRTLIKEQRAWLAERNKDCADATDMKACLQPLYEARLKELSDLQQK